jgi:carbon storage regulator CsrA
MPVSSADNFAALRSPDRRNAMLVLSRKSHESVVVGGGGGLTRLVKVTVLGIVGGRVKLGFEVDADIPVNRHEVWVRMCESGELDSRGADPRAESQHLQ